MSEQNNTTNNPANTEAPDTEGNEQKNETTPEQKQVQAEAKRKYKLKVDDVEEEYDEDAVLKMAQKARGADKRFNEGAKLKRQAEEFIRALKTNPRAVLAHPSLGLDLRKFAEEFLYEQIQEERLSPEEKRAKQEREELDRYRKSEKERKEQARLKSVEAMKEQYRQEYTKKFITALDIGGLPKTDWTIQRMAAYMRQASAQGYKHIEPKDVVDLVKQDWLDHQKHFFSSMDDSKLVEFLGEEIVEKVRKHNLKKLGVNQNSATPDQGIPDDSKTPNFSSAEELHDYLAKKRRRN